MKKIITALVALVIVPTSALAQNSIEDLFGGRENLVGAGIQVIGGALRSQQGRQEAIKVGKENEKINAAQPAVLLRGLRTRLLASNNELSNYSSYQSDAWLLASSQHMLTDGNVGAVVGFDESQLQQLTDFFSQVNDNQFVDPATKYGRELKAPEVQIEIATKYIESSSDLEGFVGRLFRGLGFNLERSTSYVGLIFSVRALTGQYAGNVVATYKVIGRSSVTDRLEVSLFDSIFGRGQGFSNQTDEKTKRDMNAAEDAFKQMRGILIAKAAQFSR